MPEGPTIVIFKELIDQQHLIGQEVIEVGIRVHPVSMVSQLPLKLRECLVDEARNYSFDFLRWKKEFTLKAHWLAHAKKICPRCNIPFHKEYVGKTKRRSFFCTKCQIQY